MSHKWDGSVERGRTPVLKLEFVTLGFGSNGFLCAIELVRTMRAE